MHILPPSSTSRVAVRTLIFFAVCACTSGGEVVVYVDAPLDTGERQIMLVPTDPAPLRPALVPPTSPAQADSLHTLTSLDDSATTLDSNFQRARRSLNTEAAEMASMDRRSGNYATRYESFRRRAAAADSIRTARDKISSRAAAMRHALAPLLPDSARITQHAADYSATLRSATAGERSTRVVAAPAGEGPVMVTLLPGDWWIGLAYQSLAPPRFTKVNVAEKSRDTVRIQHTPGR
jgi:hypothetical protein